jgi:hypothetical protein
MAELSIIALYSTFHRTGVILAFISTLIMIFLPRLYAEREDISFAKRSYTVLLWLARLGLLFLVISGGMRIVTISPVLIIKMLVALSAILHYFIPRIEYESPKYMRVNIMRISLLSLTAIMGILI